MSELAFDSNGDPVAFPAAAEELRVRRFRNPSMRGACEVVRDQDGAPIYVPVDTGYAEFLSVVERVPGRYRLDPVDAERRVMGDAAPAYVMVSEPHNAGSRGGERDEVIRELVRANVDMARTMTEKFADVMQAAADLLRAADGAGLPRRQPQVEPAPRNAAVEDDDDLDDDVVEDEDESAESPELNAMIAQLMPMLQMWLASKVASTQPAPPAAAASEGPQVPDPVEVPAEVPAGETPRNVGVPTAAQQAQLVAVYQQLEPTDQGVVRAAVARMAPEVRAIWLQELCGMTTAEGLAVVRSLLPEVNEAWLPSPAQQLCLLRLYGALDRNAARVAWLAIRRMPEEVRQQWLREVCAIPTEEAAAVVRSMTQPRGERT